MMGENEASIAQARPGSHPVEDRDGCIEDQVPPRGGRLRLKHLFWCDCHILTDPCGVKLLHLLCLSRAKVLD